MELSAVSLVIAVIALAISIIALLRKPATPPPGERSESVALRLQAYERLVLLTERIALPNLISRLNQPGISAAEMKLILTENIKQEFEYNSTQQLYVTPLSWDAVRNLKEQNIMVIHQVAGSLPLDASAADLNRKILEVVMSQPNGNLHELVSQALNHEAKKLM
ncbi:MAG: hypothetical protein NTW29_20570 [Bacteroidetes bacterium]|nr:hypothetical protein [Bacteroidota bacterium]